MKTVAGEAPQVREMCEGLVLGALIGEELVNHQHGMLGGCVDRFGFGASQSRQNLIGTILAAAAVAPESWHA